MKEDVIRLQIPRGLAAGAVGWACGFAISYAIGSVVRPLWDVGHGGSWTALHKFELARLLLPATTVASLIGASAFATYAPPGRHRLIETLGLIFLVAIPIEWILIPYLPQIRGYGYTWWLSPREVMAAVCPSLAIGFLVAAIRARQDAMDEKDPPRSSASGRTKAQSP